MLAGRTVMIAGAAGNGVAAGLRSTITTAGARLVLIDSNLDALDAAGQQYEDGITIQADIAHESQLDSAFAELARRGVVLDGLVNNAGIGMNKLVTAVSTEEFDQVMAVDLRGTWLVSKHFGRQAEPGSAIVNISSVHARASQFGHAVYAAAKAGVEGLTRGIALDLGPLGIRCNAVAPGLVRADQNAALFAAVTADPEQYHRRHNSEHQALLHQIDTDDVGWAVTFLLSDLARSITAQTLAVDAGMSAMLYDRVWVGDHRQ